MGHYNQLSEACKCMVHQLAGPEQPRPPAVIVESVETFGVDAAERYHPRHSTCFFFMPLASLILCLFFLRFLCGCCRSAKPQFAAVVPPERTVIHATIEPLMANS